MATPVPVANEHCRTGENPLWHPEERAVYWTDIPAGKVFRLDPATGVHRTVYEGEQVGGFTLQADGRLLLFRVKDFAAFDPATGKLEVLGEFTDDGLHRFNDVMADPEGRVFAGTIGKNNTSGGLYRVDPDGRVTRLHLGTAVSNGMGFTPDLGQLYWTDSTAKTIFRFRYDRATGNLSERAVIHQAGPEDGTPDGLVVDAAGDLWSARWDGHAILKIRPDGTVTERHPFPVAKVSSLCFAGDRLDTFYVTTAGGASKGDTEDGTLYRLDLGVKGPDRFRSRIRI
jgi:sugar lactone lactonase YvrE